MNTYYYSTYQFDATRVLRSLGMDVDLTAIVGIDYKSAWFLCHRVRFAIDSGALGSRLRRKS